MWIDCVCLGGSCISLCLFSHQQFAASSNQESTEFLIIRVEIPAFCDQKPPAFLRILGAIINID